MEPTREAVIGKGKRPTSPTKFPKRMASYVVAFAVQETFDDPHKLEQITNKQSADSTDSIRTITPSDSISTKTFVVSPTEHSVVDITNLKEVKINIVDENQCGDVTEKKSTQLSNTIIIDKGTADKQPEIIFNAPKYKRCKENNKYLRKKPKKSKRVIKFTNIHFKYKKSKNCINGRLEKYYENAKSNTPKVEKIQKQIYCNDLSKVVSRSRVLKKVLAKQNLLADSEQISSHDNISFNFDDESLNSLSINSSLMSQKTLVYTESFSSKDEDEYSSIKPISSVIQVPSDNKDAGETACSSSNEKFMQKENLTSSETFLQNSATELTSKSSSREEPKPYKIDYNDLTLSPLNVIENVENVENNDTIIQAENSVVERSIDDNTFVNTRTRLDFNKSSISSNFTFQNNSEITTHSENMQSSLPTIENFSNDISENNALLDRVKTLGFYPMKSPIGSGTDIDCESNDVLDTDNISTSWSFTKNVSDDCPADTKKTCVLRKLVEVKNMNYFQNSISLPDDVAIKAKLMETREEKRSCADEVGKKYPTNMGEMWEQVVLVIDLTVKRMEEAFVQRIVNDVKESLQIFSQPEYKLPTAEVPRTTPAAPVSNKRPIPTMFHKAVFVNEEHLKLDKDACVQCDLVQKQVIDQLVLQLSLLPKPNPASEETEKILKPPELLKDYTEVLKPPVAQIYDSASVEEGKGDRDTATVSTATTEYSIIRRPSRIKRLISCPVEVIRENMVIMTSVPTFFIVLFCLYGVIVVVMKPW